MSRKTFAPLLLAALVAITIAQLSASSNAAAGLRGTRLLDQTGCCKRCPACDHVCNLDAKQVDEAKTCFEVESKVICIPRVVFPWQKKSSCNSCDACDGRGCSTCSHNGARTRRVCVLKSDKYTCPKCEYTWTAEKKPCATGCATNSCDAGSAAANCDAAPSYRERQSEGLQPVDVEGSHEVLPQRVQ